MKACDGPDGAFLVRESDRYEGSYTLSFWYQGGPHHVLIARRDDGRYGMANAEETFPNLYEMIEYYKRTPIKSKTDKSFKLQLDKYVPQLFNHEKFDWFHKGVSRATAEKYLLAARKDGTFLVRASESDPNAFAISFLAEGKLKHCRLKVEVKNKKDNIVSFFVCFANFFLHRDVCTSLDRCNSSRSRRLSSIFPRMHSSEKSN